jgi:hypothetical protein
VGEKMPFLPKSFNSASICPPMLSVHCAHAKKNTSKAHLLLLELYPLHDE